MKKLSFIGLIFASSLEYVSAQGVSSGMVVNETATPAQLMEIVKKTGNELIIP